MSAIRTVAASGLLALLLALSVVALISLSGVPPVRLSSTSSTTSQGVAVETTSAGAQTAPTTVSTSEETSTFASMTSSQGQASGNQGVLSVLITDPPRVPTGVTAIYVYYIGLAVHDARGWTTIMVAGDVELMGTVDMAQTLASTSIPTGSYDAVRFDLTSALVTYEGVNYTAIVQGGKLTIQMAGDAVVSSSQPAAALVDVQSTIVNVGSRSSPQFVLWADARAFPVPSAQVSQEVETEGHRLSLSGVGWWENDRMITNATLRLSGVSLSTNDLRLTVSNVGSSGTWLKMVVVTPANSSVGMAGEYSIPSVVTGSAVFVVLGNGTLVQFLPLLHVSMPMLSGESQASVLDALSMAGYNLTAGASLHLSYSGSIELSFGLVVLPRGITSGTSYWVTVIGDNAVTSNLVTAT